MIVFLPIPRERVPFVWEEIKPLLRKAIGHDEAVDEADVYGRLVSGQSEAFWLKGDTVNGIAVISLGPIDGVEVCWLNYVAGTIYGGPKAFIEAARWIVEHISILASDAGCTELRGGGRDWSRVFPEWEHYDPEHPNRIRKTLNG
jgi:hypothetical protein